MVYPTRIREHSAATNVATAEQYASSVCTNVEYNGLLELKSGFVVPCKGSSHTTMPMCIGSFTFENEGNWEVVEVF